jgi:hypothetical protein
LNTKARMKSYQEFVIESEKGMKFKMLITKLETGGFRWDCLESENSIDSVLEIRTKNPTSGEPFRIANTAFEDMIQWVINRLEEPGDDKIKDLNNPGDCEFISSEAQKRIVARQPYPFPIKVKGK